MMCLSDFFDSLVFDSRSAQRVALEAAYMRGRNDALEDLGISLPLALRPTATEVLATVSAISGVPDITKGLRAGSRRHHYIERAAAAVLLHEDADLSYPACARALGYVDHTSVIHHVRRWKTVPRVATLVGQARAHISARRAA